MSCYTRSSKTRYYSKEDNVQFKSDRIEYLKSHMGDERTRRETPGCSLLDNSLISATNQKKYSIKIIECGDYKQVYYYSDIRLKKDKNLIKSKDPPLMNKKPEEVKKSEWGSNTTLSEVDAISFFDISIVDTDFLFKQNNLESFQKSKEKEKKIEYKNIMRSKFQMQRLVKSNIDKFHTFITLTFADNVTSIEDANKKFAIWRTKVKSIKKDFLYVCVPEFQKRGAVHYHLLTNLDMKENHDLIIPQKNKKHQYDVKYWSYGFSSVFDLKDINVVGYISKYMTKDIDDRLWGKRRYLYSQNLKTPTLFYLDFDDLDDLSKFMSSIQDSIITYESDYVDKFQNEIKYIEYKKAR